MAHVFNMPQLGSTMEEGTILKWHKQVGDAVREGETLLEIETDKATMEVEATATGVLRAILAGPDSLVAIRVPIAIIGGADEAIDYTATDVGKAVREMTGTRGVDVVVDSVGAATWRHSLAAAAKKGRIVTCGATSGPAPPENINVIFWKQLSILGSTMGTDAEFTAMLAAVDAGRLEPVVDTVFPLTEVRKAYERMASGKAFGKIVLKVSA